jgi:acyl carrier protein
MIEDTIRAFLQDRFRASLGAKPLEPDTSLFSSGIVDSFGVLELIAFLDDTFGVDIDPARHELAEFDTIVKTAALVRKLQGKGTAG